MVFCKMNSETMLQCSLDTYRITLQLPKNLEKRTKIKRKT